MLRRIILLLMLLPILFVAAAEAAPQWQATLWVQAGGGENELVLGADDTATDGFDNRWDVYTMLGGQLRSYFPHTDWAQTFQQYCRDIRAKAPGKTTEWMFVVESDLGSTSVTITRSLSLFPSDHQISLIDDTAGKTIDMRSNSSYSFTYTGKRNFRVSVYAPETPVQTNKAPVANAGPDQTVECAHSYGADITLDGSASSDPDGDSLTYTWAGIFGTASGVKPQVQIPVGAHTITLTVDDGKGGASQDTVLITVNKDNVPPSITAKLTGTSGNNEWYISSVSVELISKDSCSGSKEIHYILNGTETTVSSSSASITVDKGGVNNLSYWAMDNAGNKGATYNQTLNIDKTLPTITAVVSPAANAGGWNNTDVTVSFVCNDSASGVASCTSPITVTNEGKGQVNTGAVVDNAGNTATASVTLNIDKTSPVVNISAEPESLWPPNKKMVDVSINGSATDVTSAISSVNITVTDEYGIYNMTVPNFGSAIQLEAWREGTDSDGRRYTITAVAIDMAGNKTTGTADVIVPLNKGKQ